MHQIINDLLNYGLEHGITMIATNQLSPYTPSGTDTETKRIVFNMNWHDKKQLPLQLAHELQHIMNGDNSSEPLYFTPTRNKIEHQANIGAIKMLLPYYLEDKQPEDINVYDFMDQFSIPSYLDVDIMNIIKAPSN